MALSRNFTEKINFILDNICPPILRDCYPLMYLIYRLVYGKNTKELMKYKDVYPFLSDEEYFQYYKYAAATKISSRPTDLNQESISFILANTIGEGKCLDAGCGRGYLAKILSAKGYCVFGLDIEMPNNYSKKDNYTFIQGSVENMPFPDRYFETVISAHVLEHVRDFDRALSELLRVAKYRLIIVLPRQREYRYVADLHIRYFPYEYNVRRAIQIKNAKVVRVGSDWGVLIHK